MTEFWIWLWLSLYVPSFWQHEKFTSQLQLGKKPTCAEPVKTPKSSPDKPKASKPAETHPEPAVKSAEPNKGDDKMQGKRLYGDVRVTKTVYILYFCMFTFIVT